MNSSVRLSIGQIACLHSEMMVCLPNRRLDTSKGTPFAFGQVRHPCCIAPHVEPWWPALPLIIHVASHGRCIRQWQKPTSWLFPMTVKVFPDAHAPHANTKHDVPVHTTTVRVVTT